MSPAFEAVGESADHYGDWGARLRLEIPFLASLLRLQGARRVCDAGCGEGRHTLALAQAGFEMTGVDPREEALVQARQAAQRAGAAVQFHRGGFQSIPRVPGAPFDAVLAWGNSLSLVGEWEDLDASVRGVADAIAEGGVFICQVPNYRIFDDPAKRWRPLREAPGPEAGQPVLLMKHFAPWSERYFAAEFVRIWRDSEKGWTSEVKQVRLLALTEDRLEACLAQQFEIVARRGHADGRPFNPDSPDLIVVARKSPQR